mmetsp:Transcript_16312/g.26454  ORF Transcript_16312/g.26454 Transcript_16312/m.26454 type:complete len:201 (-) Transcript_16312:19-621(-)
MPFIAPGAGMPPPGMAPGIPPPILPGMPPPMAAMAAICAAMSGPPLLGAGPTSIRSNACGSLSFVKVTAKLTCEPSLRAPTCFLCTRTSPPKTACNSGQCIDANSFVSLTPFITPLQRLSVNALVGAYVRSGHAIAIMAGAHSGLLCKSCVMTDVRASSSSWPRAPSICCGSDMARPRSPWPRVAPGCKVLACQTMAKAA